MKVFVIPDCQVRPGDSLDYLYRIGKYCAEKQPDVIVNIGDFADMPSLSSYDKGKKAFEGRRYVKDVDAVKRGMDKFMQGLSSENWTTPPRMVFCYGNHEERILRAANDSPELEGLVKLADLEYEAYGWETVPFLVPITIEGVVFSHYYPSGVMGRPVTSASRLITTKHQSCIAGHQQGRSVAYGQRADGTTITAIIAGSCYEHDEDYMSYVSNRHWRGMLALHQVQEGSFDEMFVSLDFLKGRYK